MISAVEIYADFRIAQDQPHCLVFFYCFVAKILAADQLGRRQKKCQRVMYTNTSDNVTTFLTHKVMMIHCTWYLLLLLLLLL